MVAMVKIWKYLTGCWQGVLTVVGVVGTIVVINSFYSSLATSADLNKVKESVKQAKEEALLYTQQAVQQLKKTMDLDRDIIRLNNVNESLMRTKQLLKSHPKDQDLRDDLEMLKAEKTKLQQRVEQR